MTSIEIVEQNVPNKEESTKLFSRTLIESMNKQVRLVDSDNGLDLFCYIKCESTDSDTLKKCRGVVFNGDKIIMNGFPYTYEQTEDHAEKIIENIGSILDKCSFYDSYEGSLIRMFYYGEKWYITTNRKLDANKSKWSSKESFGFFFKQSLEIEIQANEKLISRLSEDTSIDLVDRFQSTLDINKQYMFLLLNNEQNRIVCNPHVKSNIFHVGTFIDGNLSMDEDIGISYPRKHNFTNLSDIFNYVNSVNIQKIQGIIIFAPNNTQYKIFNKEYYDLYKARGNEPSIKFRYLQIRMDKRYNNMLHYLYPNYSQIFDDFENSIYEIAKIIHKAYLDRFIKNIYVIVPKEEYAVIKECHTWHLKDRTQNKINLIKVITILNTQNPTYINKMIRRFYLEQHNKNKQVTDGVVSNDTNFPELNKRSAEDVYKNPRHKQLLDRNKKIKVVEVIEEVVEVVEVV